jgi:Glycosyltransferase family 9 (heptosyltransferase)
LRRVTLLVISTNRDLWPAKGLLDCENGNTEFIVSVMVVERSPAGKYMVRDCDGSVITTQEQNLGLALNIAVLFAIDHHSPDVILHITGEPFWGNAAEILETAMSCSPCLATPAIDMVRDPPVDCFIPVSYQGTCAYVPRLFCDRSRWVHVDLVSYPLFTEQREDRAIASLMAAYTPTTFKKLGGWPTHADDAYAWVLGVSLRAWFADCPVITLPADRARICIDFMSFRQKRDESRTESALACSEVFDEATWRHTVKPWFDTVSARLERRDVVTSRVKQQSPFGTLKLKTDIEFFEEVHGPGNPGKTVRQANASRGLYCVGSGLGNVLLCVPAMKALSSLSGAPIDIWDRGVRQGEVLDLLRSQMFVQSVFERSSIVDPSEYQYIVGSFWADVPFEVSFSSYVGRASRNWHQKHEVECNMDAVRALGYSDETPSADIVSANDESYLSQYRQSVVVGIGCASYQVKQYPFWEEVCADLANRKIPLVFMGTKHDHRGWMSEYGADLTGSVSLSKAAAIVHHASLYLGIDNGLSHLAAAVGTPSVVLYGPSSYKKNHPWTSKCIILLSDQFACSPCWGHPRALQCRYEQNARRPCMSNIKPGYVASRVISLMEEITHRARTGEWVHNVPGTSFADVEDGVPSVIQHVAGQQLFNVMAFDVTGLRWIREFAIGQNRAVYVLTASNIGRYITLEPKALHESAFENELLQLRKLGVPVEEISLSEGPKLTGSASGQRRKVIDLVHLGVWRESEFGNTLGRLVRWMRPGGFILFQTSSLSADAEALEVLACLKTSGVHGSRVILNEDDGSRGRQTAIRLALESACE